jgi:hypothetical protein
MTFYTDHYPPAVAFGFHGAVPSTHFPPLYSMVLALFEGVGLSAGSAVRWSSAMFHAVNLLLVAVMLSRVLTRRVWTGAIAGAAVLLTIGTWLSTHTFALSEALLLTCTLGALLALSRYLVTSSPRALAVLATCAAAAVLTRWVGVSVAVTAGVLIMARRVWPVRARLGRAAIVVGAGATAGFGWALFGRIAGGSSPRLLAFHPPARFVGPLLEVLGTWFVRPEPAAGVVLVLGAALGVGVVMAVRGMPEHLSEDTQHTWLLRSCAVFAVTYVVMVYGARTFFDASIPTSGAKGILAAFEAPRIYMPLLPVVLVLVLAAIERMAAAYLRGPRARWAGIAVPVVCIALATFPPSHVVDSYRDTSRLVTATRPRSSPLIRAIEFLPPDATIATNMPSTVYGATGRSSLMVPLRRIPVTDAPNSHYNRDAAEMAAVLQRHNGFLVLFPAALGVSSSTDTTTLALYSRLVTVAKYPEGTIYRVLPR